MLQQPSKILGGEGEWVGTLDELVIRDKLVSYPISSIFLVTETSKGHASCRTLINGHEPRLSDPFFFFFAGIMISFRVETNRCNCFLIGKRYWKYQSENTAITLHYDALNNISSTAVYLAVISSNRKVVMTNTSRS